MVRVTVMASNHSASVFQIRTCYSPDRPANKFCISLFAGWKLCRMWLGTR